MKLIAINCDENLKQTLSSEFTIEEGGEAPIFINWLKEEGEQPEKLLKQVKFLEHFISQKRTIFLFDGDSQLKTAHIEYLLQKNVILAEPCIIPRTGFIWWPHPIDTKEPGIRTQEKKYDLYIEPGNSNNFVSLKLAEECGLSYSEDYRQCKFALQPYTTRNSLKGYLRPVDHLLKAYCFPLIYGKNRFYYSLFRNWTVVNKEDLLWMSKIYESTDYGQLKEFHEIVNTMWPEMRLENAIGKLKECLS
jgi:hypothetical protein